MAHDNTSYSPYSKDVVEFVTVANEYCTFIENEHEFDRRQFLERIQKLFTLIYLKASLIPELSDEFAEIPEKFVTEEDYNYFLEKLQHKFGEFDAYHEVFVADIQFSENALSASIAENICDIYQDLKDFVLNYQNGTNEIMYDALVDCLLSFKNYWGQQLVNGLRAIHSLLYGDNDIDSTEMEQFESRENKKQLSGVEKMLNHLRNNTNYEELE